MGHYFLDKIFEIQHFGPPTPNSFDLAGTGLALLVLIMKSLGIIITTLFVAISYNACSEAIFSSTSSKAVGGGPGGLGIVPVVPEFGGIIDCHSDFNLPAETLSLVSCSTAAGEQGVYISALPLDGMSQVETLCLTPEVAAQTVKASCTCTNTGEKEYDHDSDSEDSLDEEGSSDDDSYSSDDDSGHSYYTAHRSYDHDSDSEDSLDEEGSSDDDSNSSDDDSDDVVGGEVCVPSTTVQFRLGNCADLF
jgi:hypothetical protein